jgi:hypothetical protein
VEKAAEASFGEEKAVASYRTPKAAFGREARTEAGTTGDDTV